ncbi:MAG: sigma-70 family RNA polymerase sigma factor [Actinobacteria bacterium]|nr:sigma-70 family RNA polymerase sigma factor [Actinomycetota bacterium]
MDARAEFVEYHRTRDRTLRDKLVEEHLGVAYALARGFAGHGEEGEDLRQVALLALFKSVERFDPDFGVSFSTFAIPTIVGELKRHLRDHGWAVRPPREVQDRSREVAALVETLTHELHRSPTVAEVATRGEFESEDVVEAMEALSSCRRINNAVDESLPPGVGVVDGGLERVEKRATVVTLLEKLPPRQREIVVLRFFEGQTQSQIAQRMGVSQMQISRLLRRSLHELRTAAQAASGTRDHRTRPSRRRADTERRSRTNQREPAVLAAAS